MRKVRDASRKLRGVRWKPWALLGMAALAGWFYAAPGNLTKRIRSAVEEPRKAATPSLISSRVDFAQVNAQLSGDLHGATQGRLNGESFSQLLLFGWLPQQRRKIDVDEAADHTADDNPAPGIVPVRAEHTRLYHVRYKDLNRVMAIYWDASQIHEVVLTLERNSVLHRWRVTRVHQFNVCAYDFDCALVSPEDLLSTTAPPAHGGPE